MYEATKKVLLKALKCAFKNPQYNGCDEPEKYYLINVDYIANCNDFFIAITNDLNGNQIQQHFRYKKCNFTLFLQTHTADLKTICKIMQRAEAIVKKTISKGECNEKDL